MAVEFDGIFFMGEEREGFYVEPLMKRAWAAQIEFLQEIRAVLERHNIRWFAGWGTLLGAVRHKGFVPWDDDIDIVMLRDDYKRFLEISAEEWPSGCEVLNHKNNKDFIEMLSRIVNTKHICWEPAFLEKYHGCPFQVGIDVFPLDYIPEKPEDYNLWMALIQMVSHTASMYRAGMADVNEAEREAVTAQIEELLGTTFDRQVDMSNQMLLYLDRIFGMYGKADAAEVGFAAFLGSPSVDRYHMPKDCYRDTVDMPFENITVPVPIGYDTVLKARYGEYQKYNVYHPHDYPFYRKQQEILKEHVESNPQDLELVKQYLS